jgi:hypothetical protein
MNIIEKKNVKSTKIACHTTNIFENKAYIFGGVEDKESKLFVYDFKKNLLNEIKITQNFVKKIRYSHSSILYKERIIIFGGIHMNF